MKIIKLSLPIQVSLLYKEVDAFQTLKRKPIHSAANDHSSRLYISQSQSIAAAQTVSPDATFRGALKEETSRSISSIGKKPQLSKPIPSGQKQLPLHLRIAKGIYEESLPWIISFSLPIFASLVSQSSTPIISHLGAELLFLAYCTDKLFRKLNVPTTPEPLVNREWEDVVRQVWASQPDISSRREFVMGWFYDVPFEQLRMEDVISYLAWLKYGLPLESGIITEEEIESLCEFDLPLLLDNINEGKSLPKRRPHEKPLPFIRFNCEPLRYRHKPILFYVVTHGINMILQRVLEKNGFKFVPAKDSGEDLSYWYRLPSQDTNKKHEVEEESNPLVFIHGVGGMAFCYNLIEDLKRATQESNVPIILVDLPHVSLRMYDEIPKIKSQINSISRILDDVTMDVGGESLRKATFVGHSYGTLVMSWMIKSNPERVAGCIFLDPVCFQLHLKTSLFNFHLQRVDEAIQANASWESPFSVGSLINLAGTEMHTNYAMLRQFSWATNALWPEDLMEHSLPTSVILSGRDEIVPVKDVENLFQSSSEFLKTHTFDGASHGDIFIQDSLRSQTVDKILEIMRIAQNDSKTEEWDRKKDLESLFISI